MFKTYLSKKTHYIFLFGILIFIIFGKIKYGIFLFLIYLVFLIIFRKNFRPYYKEVNTSKGIIFSPVCGEVRSIRYNINHKILGKGLTEIRFLISVFNEQGLYLPTQGEIKNLIMNWGYSANRFGGIPEQEKEVLAVPLLEIKNKVNEIIGMQFVECTFGFFPHFYILPGDRGMAMANFGYFPFGGTVLLYLPGNYEILVKENSKVSPKDVLIARVKA